MWKQRLQLQLSLLVAPLLWTLIGCLAVVSGISIWKLNRMSVLALPFALTAFTLLVTVPGQPLVTVAGLTVTDTGLARFIEVLLKSWLSMQTALLLTLSTPITDLLTALAQLKVPATLIAIIGFMYRYLFILKDEAERLLRARVPELNPGEACYGGRRSPAGWWVVCFYAATNAANGFMPRCSHADMMADS